MPVDRWELLKLLADPTRLRILALLEREELAVSELCEVLAMGQSRISTHLGQLRSAELVIDRKEGKRTYYRGQKVLPEQRDVVTAAIRLVPDTAEGQNDADNLRRVLDQRREKMERYFDEVAGLVDRRYCPGRSWQAVSALLFRLMPEIEVADLGSGEGILSQMLARRAKKITCVDQSAEMVRMGRELAKRQGHENLHFIQGDLEAVPLGDASVDVTMLSQALHHAEHPAQAVAEAYRITRPGGTVVILDLNAHDFEPARELYADRWLGFDRDELQGFLQAAGFRSIDVSIVAREEKTPQFETILATATR